MSKASVIAITDAIGSAAIQEALGVSDHSVRHARTTGLFPASWYGVLSEECRKIGVECPVEAFNFKPPAVTPAQTDAA